MHDLYYALSAYIMFPNIYGAFIPILDYASLLHELCVRAHIVRSN